MSDPRNIDINEDDCVIVFKLDGKAHMFPSSSAMEMMEENIEEDYIEIPDNLILLTALGHKLREPEFIEMLHNTFDELAKEEEAEYLGVSSDTLH